MTSVKRLAVLAMAMLISVSAWALTDKQRADIEMRIKPVGDVCLQGDSDCGAVAVASSGPRSGEEVYTAACAACHTSGIAGAPKLGAADDWTDRIAKGMDVLYDSGVNGLAGTGMIAKGGCANCSDEEVNSAVDYMVDSSQ